jgi:cytochrome c oxidase subunit III
MSTSTATLDSAHSGAHASASASTAKFGMIIFLISEGMLFAGLIGAYIVLRLSEEVWPPAGAPALPVLLTGINTVFLIASSVTYHFAESAVQKGKSGLGLLFVTIVLGTIFLGVQAYEWTHLYHEGLWFNTWGTYGSSFFVMTGFHGAHVLIGVLLIIWCFLKQALTRCYTPTNHISLQNVALYWHFVDVVWLFLFAIVYLW